MSADKIEARDLVVMRGLTNSPLMRVASVSQPKGRAMAECGWFDTYGMWHEHTFAADFLTKIPED
jgi:uncharacterized protein YodC (DUF2158 family)